MESVKVGSTSCPSEEDSTSWLNLSASGKGVEVLSKDASSVVCECTIWCPEDEFSAGVLSYSSSVGSPVMSDSSVEVEVEVGWVSVSPECESGFGSVEVGCVWVACVCSSSCSLCPDEVCVESEWSDVSPLNLEDV